MGKAKMIGQFKPSIPNSRADLRRTKAWKRNRECTDRHEEVLGKSREERLMKESQKR